MANGVDTVSHDLISLLSSGERDFLIRNTGDQVKIDSLSGKIIGLYFSGSWCGPCRRFTPTLVETYEELTSNGKFQVVFISSDETNESFVAYFAKMPWLAIPFSDSKTRDSLNDLFKVRGIPALVIINENGIVLSNEGVDLVKDYGSEAYPFTQQMIKDLKEEEEKAKNSQSLSSLLISKSLDFLISKDGIKTPVSELEGKIVGLYFSALSHSLCAEFTPKLIEVYNILKENGENFEIALISLDREEEEFKQGLEVIPWLSLPFNDKRSKKLIKYFELETLPTLVIIGADGKTLNPNVVEFVENHDIKAYPFTPEKLSELVEIDKARLEMQTLESILISEELDFVIEKGGSKVLISELFGKNILLYFSAHWCPPCRSFLPILIKAYNEIRAKDSEFEVIFISSDHDQSSFDSYFSTMPWLALPFGDTRKSSLSRRFKIRGIPTLVAIGPNGRTVTNEARKLVQAHGSDAYPFTEDRLRLVEERADEVANTWPEKLVHELHEHELSRVRRGSYYCDECEEGGQGWSFYCAECDYDLHPKCALKTDDGKEGWMCEGGVCKKA